MIKRIKKLPGARKAALPDFIAPQLATLVPDAPSGDDWLHELKFDGYRMVCHLQRGIARFWSRNQKDWTEKFPNLSKALKSLPAIAAILDGEVVVVDKAGRSSFQKLQQSMKGGASTFVFQIFDLIYLDGYNLTRVPLRRKKSAVGRIAGWQSMPKGPLRYSDHVVGNGDRFFQAGMRLRHRRNRL